jgi:hypothetical protein
VVLSTDPTVAGQGSVTITPAQQSNPVIYAQALASSGTVTVSASAATYQTGTTMFTLAPSGAVIGSGPITLTAGNTSQASIYLSALNAATLQPISNYPTYMPRPGANLSVAFASSDPSTVSVTPSQISFPITTGNASPSVPFSVRGLKTGSATVSISPLAGQQAASSGQQIPVTVNPPDLLLPDFTFAGGFVVPLQVTLSSRLPTPTQPISISIQTSDRFLIGLVGDPSTSQVTYNANATIPAGSRQSTPFYLVGLASSGTATLSISGYPYNSTTTQVTLTQGAFALTPGGPLNMPLNSSVTVQLLPALSGGSPAPPQTTIWSGVASVPVTIASSNPSVVSVVPTEVLFQTGVNYPVTFRALASGTSTISLSGTSYDFSSTLAITVH